MFSPCKSILWSVLIGVSVVFLSGCSDETESAKDAKPITAAAPAQPTQPAGPGKDEKACFVCNGSGTIPCRAKGCVSGQVECPGPCLKLTRGSWVHMNVPGHDPKELWRQFRKPNGGMTAWNQGHVGEVIVFTNGDYANIGPCRICSGTTRVGCRTCKSLGRETCELCAGKKYVPIAWTPTNNPWLDKQPDVIRLTDGRVLLGTVVLSSGDDRTVKLRDGKITHVNVSEIVARQPGVQDSRNESVVRLSNPLPADADCQMRKLISILCLAATIASAWADGMVVSQTFRVKVEIPNQQALLCLSNGVEKLVIETAFIGEGTNFAWVVPLPAAPEVRPVSTTFFPTLRAGFAPHLVHQVPKYYVGTLFLLGLVYLGWRCLRGEVSPIVDLPLCLAIGAGVWIATNHVAFGIIALSFALLMRSYANSSTSYALILIVGAAFAPVLIHALDVTGKLAGRLINTMGSDASLSTEIAGVEIVSVQHAGLFDVTTIKGTGATGVLSWLEKNGYEAPPSAEPVIQEYVRKGWVFVASKVRRTHEPLEVSCVHPLAFIFPSKQLIYPTRLTGLNEQDCLMELFVFGDRRAMASGFKAVRCERLAGSGQGPRSERKGMRIEDPELLEYVGSSTVGTLLRGKLSPRQMAEDVVVKSTLFWRSGRHVYSRSAALTVAANVGLPLIALAWIAVGMCAGGWRVDEKWILRWRVRWMAATVAATVLVYVSLPVVEVEQVIHHHSRHDDFARLNPGIPVLENGGGRGYGHERESHNSEGRHVLGGSSHCRFSLGS